MLSSSTAAFCQGSPHNHCGFFDACSCCHEGRTHREGHCVYHYPVHESAQSWHKGWVGEGWLVEVRVGVNSMYEGSLKGTAPSHTQVQQKEDPGLTLSLHPYTTVLMARC